VNITDFDMVIIEATVKLWFDLQRVIRAGFSTRLSAIETHLRLKGIDNIPDDRRVTERRLLEPFL
jgi:hypothetical protein